MTSFPQFAFQEMDAGHLEDRMELASSPLGQVDDLDLEFDQIREPALEPAHENSMMDDLTEPGDAFQDFVQDDITESPQDDRMSDEDQQGADVHEFVNDFDMEAFEQNDTSDEDEEILYEEDDTAVVVHQNAEDIEAHSDLHPEEEGILTPEEIDMNTETAETLVRVTENAFEDATEDSQRPVSPDGEEIAKYLVADTSHQPSHILERHQEPNQDEDVTAIETEDRKADPGFDDSSAQYDESNKGRAGDHDQPTSDQKQTTGLSNEIATVGTASEEAIGEQTIHPAADLRDGQAIQIERDATSDMANGQLASLQLVKLVYLGEEMSLFPPEQEASGTFFLSDTSLAFERIDKLLSACRQILSDSIGHDDELVLDVPVLGLHICEDSKYAEQMTLSQVLEVYLTLNHNEQIDRVESLYCTLSSRVSLASQYAYLSGAAQEGKFFSEIAADYIDSPDEDLDVQVEPPTQEAQEIVPNEDNPSEDFTEDALHVKNHGTQDEETGVGLESTNIEHMVDKQGQLSPPVAESGPTNENTIDDNADTHDPLQESRLESAVNENSEPTVDSDSANNAAAINATATHETDTNSSHTIHADLDGVTQEEKATVAGEFDESFLDDEAEPEESYAEHGQTQILPEGNGEEPLPLADGYEPYSDEELFIESDDEQDAEVNDHEDTAGDFAPAEQTQPEDRATNGKHEDLPGNSSSVKVMDQFHLEPAQPTPPVTPTKAKSAKRKTLEDDDEFDLLDNDTPEPKRRRPS